MASDVPTDLAIARAAKLRYAGARSADEAQETGSEHCQQNELVDLLREKIDQLNPRQRRILSMIYFDNMHLSEIADVFGVTEARVCQIRSQAIANLRKQMQNFIAE